MSTEHYVGKGPGTTGFKYVEEATSSPNSDFKGPITFGFIYAPPYPTTLATANLIIDIIKFPVGDYLFLEYNITLWNPNSDTSTGNVVNGMTRHGYITFDNKGGNQSGADSNNMSFPDYLTNNELPFSGVDNSLTTDTSQFTTSAGIYGTSPNNSQLFVQSDGTDFTLKFNNYKAGQKVKGLITLI